MQEKDYTITILNIFSQGLTHLPEDISQYHNLRILQCQNNKLVSLENLPNTLQELYCGNNKLTSLDN
jgi:Leucine-rich repeat (LRR) protein